MSTTPPLDQQQQQQIPPLEVVQEAYTTHRGHGSVGPVIAVLAVITILGVIAGMIGRLCTGRRVLGGGEYDFEGWVERKCSTCLDGQVDPPMSRPIDNIPVAAPVHQEKEKEEEEQEEEKQNIRDKSKEEANSSSPS